MLENPPRTTTKRKNGDAKWTRQVTVCSSGSSSSPPPTISIGRRAVFTNEKKSKPAHRDKDERTKIAIGRGRALAWILDRRPLARSCELCSAKSLPPSFREGRRGGPAFKATFKSPPLSIRGNKRGPIATQNSEGREVMARTRGEKRARGSLLSSLSLSLSLANAIFSTLRPTRIDFPIHFK